MLETTKSPKAGWLIKTKPFVAIIDCSAAHVHERESIPAAKAEEPIASAPKIRPSLTHASVLGRSAARSDQPSRCRTSFHSLITGSARLLSEAPTSGLRRADRGIDGAPPRRAATGSAISLRSPLAAAGFRDTDRGVGGSASAAFAEPAQPGAGIVQRSFRLAEPAPQHRLKGGAGSAKTEAIDRYAA